MTPLVDFIHSTLWRRRIHQEFRNLERPHADDDTAGCDELWNRISQELDTVPFKSLPVRTRPYRIAALVLMPLTLSLGLMSFYLPDSILSKPVPNGIKSASSPAVPLPESNLSFAILQADGSIVRGTESARIRAQEALIFYVETPGLAEGKFFLMDVVVQLPGGELKTVLEQYNVHSSREALHGKYGYLLYKPEVPGLHRFSGRRSKDQNNEELAGFSIEFVH